MEFIIGIAVGAAFSKFWLSIWAFFKPMLANYLPFLKDKETK